MTNNQERETPGSSSDGSGVSRCVKCREHPRDRKNASYCKECRNAMAAVYRQRSRPRPRLEERACVLDGCEQIFTWRSMNPKQECCSKAHYMQKRWRDQHPIPENTVPEDMRWCSGCEALRHEVEFSPSQWKRSQVSARCRRCMAKYEKRWASNNPERKSAASRRSRAARLLRQYGAYSDDIDQIVVDQDGVCYLCGGQPGVKGFSIDHDHAVLEGCSYRGLACHWCNMGIGAFGDDVSKMLHVAEVLAAKHQELAKLAIDSPTP